MKSGKTANADNEVSIADVELDDNKMPKIGYFCTYTPVEIIRAAGYHPVRIKGLKRRKWSRWRITSLQQYMFIYKNSYR